MPDLYTWGFPSDATGFAGTDTRVNRTLPTRLSETSVNIKDWGAVADGSTPTGAAIQAAINFCIAQGGGKVYFPAGQYNCNTNLVVGSDTNPNAFVQLIGCGGGGGTNTYVFCTGSGWMVSKGTKAYDLIQRVEGLGLDNAGAGCIKVTGQGVQIKNCHFKGRVFVDAAQAQGCMISDCGGSGSDPDSGNSGVAPIFSSGGVGFYLGDNCIATNCRWTGSFWISFALSGTGASIIGCSTEVTYMGCRVGWAPDANPAVIGGGRELAAIGCSVIGLQTERQEISLELYNCRGGFISANSLTGGHGTPSDQPITNMVWSGGTVTATTNAVHNLPSGDSVLLLNVVDETPPPIAWRPNTFTTCHNSASNQFTYAAADPGYVFSGTISSMSYSGGVVTCNTSSSGSIPIPNGVKVRLYNISGNWNPGAGNIPPVTTVPFDVFVTGGTTTTFTYAGPSTTPSGDNTGNWDRSPGVGWAYPALFCIRCRRVSETLIVGNYVTHNSSLGSVDMVYDTLPAPYLTSTAGEAVHANNMIVGLAGARGWLRPVGRNAAGWKFVNCGVNGLTPGSNPLASVSPVGSLTFANLPGQFTQAYDPVTGEALYQGGPFEGQEYDISDGTYFSTGGFGERVTGGSSGKWKVRYDGTIWRRIG